MNLYEKHRESYVQISPGQYALHSGFDVRICAHNRAVLSSQLHQARFEVLTAAPGNLSSDGCASGDVDFAHSWVFDHGVDYLGGILGPT